MKIPFTDSRVRVSRDRDLDHLDVHRELALGIYFQFRLLAIAASKKQFLSQLILESVPSRCYSFDRPLYLAYVTVHDFKREFPEVHHRETGPRGKLRFHRGNRMRAIVLYPFGQAAVMNLMTESQIHERYLEIDESDHRNLQVEVVPVKEMYEDRRPGEVLADEFFKLNPDLKASALSVFAELGF